MFLFVFCVGSIKRITDKADSSMMTVEERIVFKHAIKSTKNLNLIDKGEISISEWLNIK